VLRAVLGEASAIARVTEDTDVVTVIETNIDDMNPQLFGDVMERLLAGEIQWAMQRMFQQYDSIADSLLPTALIPEPKLPPQREWKTERPQPQLNFGE